MARDVRNPMEPPHDLRRLNGPELSALLHEVIMAAQANFDSLSGDAKEHARIFNSLARDVEMLGEYFGIEHDSEGVPVEITGGASGAHSELEGLAADDHTQYVLDAGDTMTGNLAMTNGADITFASGSTLIFGGDTNLYRYAADTLKTDDEFLIKNVLLSAVTVDTTNDTFRLSGYGIMFKNHNAGNTYIMLDSSGTGTGSMVLQAGGGSSSWGGTINLREAAHASKPGWVEVGLGVANAKFAVNDGGFGAGTEIFGLTRAGQLSLPVVSATGGLVLGGDTNLYRASANVLKTDDYLQSATYITAFVGQTQEVLLGSIVSGYAGIALGGDTSIYRTASQKVQINSWLTLFDGTYGILSLKRGASSTSTQVRHVESDDSVIWYTGMGVNALGTQLDWYFASGNRMSLSTAGQLSLPVTGSGGGLLIGGDTNLYRLAANALATDDSFIIHGYEQVQIPSAGDISHYIYVAGDADNSFYIAGRGVMNWADGTNAADTKLYRQAADVLGTDDDFGIFVAGKGLRVKEGSNAKMGLATLVLGTVVVTTTAVTANSRIFLTPETLGTVTAPTGLTVSARTAGTSFTILSGNLTDTSTVAWMIVEPA